MADAASAPRDPAGLTVGWINTLLRERGEPPAAGIRVSPLGAGEGFYGQLARVDLEYPPGRRGPAALVAKFPAADPDTRAALNRIGIYEREVNFYTRLAETAGVRVPACYHAHFDPAGGSLLIIEFVDGECRTEVEGASFAQAEVAMREAARLHRRWRGSPVLDEPWIHRLVAPEVLDGMCQGARDAVPVALERLAGEAPDWLLELAPRAADVIAAQLTALDALPHTLMHFDYRVANMIFPPVPHPDDMTLIDWQALFRGPGVCDVTMFHLASLPVVQRREWEGELVGLYLREVGAGSGAKWPEWFREGWRRMALFLAANLVRNAPVFDFDAGDTAAVVRALIERHCAAVEDHDALAFARGVG